MGMCGQFRTFGIIVRAHAAYMPVAVLRAYISFHHFPAKISLQAKRAVGADKTKTLCQMIGGDMSKQIGITEGNNCLTSI